MIRMPAFYSAEFFRLDYRFRFPNLHSRSDTVSIAVFHKFHLCHITLPVGAKYIHFPIFKKNAGIMVSMICFIPLPCSPFYIVRRKEETSLIMCIDTDIKQVRIFIIYQRCCPRTMRIHILAVLHITVFIICQRIIHISHHLPVHQICRFCNRYPWIQKHRRTNHVVCITFSTNIGIWHI